MKRQIELEGTPYDVTLSGPPGSQRLSVGSEIPLPAALTHQEGTRYSARLGEHDSQLEMVQKAETTYIKAFGRTHMLRLIDPVEQAARETGSGEGILRAPMPGMVVEIQAQEGDRVTKGQSLVTIESMKILTLIPSPRDGEVACIHFKTGDSFEKNAVLITLKDEEET